MKKGRHTNVFGYTADEDLSIGQLFNRTGKFGKTFSYL